MTDLDRSRYGRRSVPSWMKYGFFAGALTLITTWAIWGGYANKDPEIGFQQQSFQVISDYSVELSFEIFRTGGQAAQCRVYAQSLDHTIVGEKVVDVPAGEETVVVSTSIQTDRAAVTAVVDTCELVD